MLNNRSAKICSSGIALPSCRGYSKRVSFGSSLVHSINLFADGTNVCGSVGGEFERIKLCS